MSGSPTRSIALVFIAAVALAGLFFFVRNFRPPDNGREANVAEEPAGSRTQAQPTSPSGSADGSPPAIAPLGDPLQPGIPEQPDIPADSPHASLMKVGDRIKEALLADGQVGDHETPGVDMTGLSQGQRRWFLDHAVAITCSCGCGQDLLECRRDDATCPVSPGLSDSLLAVARKQKSDKY